MCVQLIQSGLIRVLPRQSQWWAEDQKTAGRRGFWNLKQSSNFYQINWYRCFLEPIVVPVIPNVSFQTYLEMKYVLLDLTKIVYCEDVLSQMKATQLNFFELQ